MVYKFYLKRILSPLLLVIIATVVLNWPERALASCDLSITVNDINVNWNLTFTHVAVSVDVNRGNANACTYSLGFSQGGAVSYDTRRVTDVAAHVMRYQLYQDSGLTKVLKDVPDVTSMDEVVHGGFQAGATPTKNTENYYFEIPYNLATIPSVVSGGDYQDTFTIKLYEGDTLPLGSLIETKSVDIAVNVPPMIALSLVASGGTFQLGQLSRDINFSNMTQGSSASLDLRVRTNAGFSITFSADNNGNMKHVNPAKNSTIPYSLIVNGTTLNMSNSNLVPVVGLSGSGSTSLTGLGYPIRVILGAIPSVGAMAGSHEDSITITATTTE